MKLLIKLELIKAILKMRMTYFLSDFFGAGWHKKGDTKSILELTYQELWEYAKEFGIYRNILDEGISGGNDKFYIVEDNGNWLFGYGEHGHFNVFSQHESLETAREAFVKECWELYLMETDPSKKVDGVAAGTPYA